jgi:DNA-directed RNA polymerase II subunit RPB11
VTLAFQSLFLPLQVSLGTPTDISHYRWEQFVLGEGEKKVEEETDTREYLLTTATFWTVLTHSPGTASTSIFTFNKEDHTLGNLLRDKLLENSHVLFSGYKVRGAQSHKCLLLIVQVPHPLFAKFELRVQTDGQITPKEAVVAASAELIRDLNILSRRFTAAYELTKMVQAGQNGA